MMPGLIGHLTLQIVGILSGTEAQHVYIPIRSEETKIGQCYHLPDWHSNTTSERGCTDPESDGEPTESQATMRHTIHADQTETEASYERK